MVACRRVAAREPPDGGFPLLTTKTHARQQQNRLATPRRASVPQNGRPGEHSAAEAAALRQAAPDPAGAVQGPRPHGPRTVAGEKPQYWRVPAPASAPAEGRSGQTAFDTHTGARRGRQHGDPESTRNRAPPDRSLGAQRRCERNRAAAASDEAAQCANPGSAGCEVHRAAAPVASHSPPPEPGVAQQPSGDVRGKQPAGRGRCRGEAGYGCGTGSSAGATGIKARPHAPGRPAGATAGPRASSGPTGSRAAAPGPACPAHLQEFSGSGDTGAIRAPGKAGAPALQALPSHSALR